MIRALVFFWCGLELIIHIVYGYIAGTGTAVWFVMDLIQNCEEYG